MTRKPTQDEVIAYLKANTEATVPQLEELFPTFDSWALRTLRRDFLRSLGGAMLPPASLEEAAQLPGLAHAARAAMRAGFFRPVQIHVTEQRPVKPLFKKAGFQYMIWSDAHAEVEDADAIDVCIQVGQAVGVDEVVFAGDWFDVHALSSYVPNADRPARWVDERAAALPVIASARAAFPKQKAHWIHGNHDRRPLHFIDRAAPQLQGMFTLPELLGIEGLDFSYPEDNRLVIADKLMIIHGERVRGESGASVRAEVKDHGMSVIMGHVHRRGNIEVTSTALTLTGEQPMFGYELGCLCNLRPSYIPAEKTANWQHGAAIVTVYDNNFVDVEPINIHNGRAAFRGRLFSSRVRKP